MSVGRHFHKLLILLIAERLAGNGMEVALSTAWDDESRTGQIERICTGKAANPYAPLRSGVAYQLAAFFCPNAFATGVDMKQVLASLRSGNWKALLACFLYFDTGFTAWVMFGPLAPYISKQLQLSPMQAGFLVAVPVLSASIVRVTLGNLFQSVNGRTLALMGIFLSALPAVMLLLPVVPNYQLLLTLGTLLGIGGASFAIALPMAGSSYPPQVQGLVLGLAAAGNVGAVVDGFLFPSLAQHWGWQRATAAVLPLLALTAVAVMLWAEDRSSKAGNARHAFVGFVISLLSVMGLVQLVSAGVFGSGKTGQLLLPALGAAVALAVLPRKYLNVLRERDTWIVMLVYSITFGGFVGMSSYVSLLLTTQYALSKVDAGMFMAALSFTGAMVRPVGGLLADRVSGVKVLLVLLLAIALCNVGFATLAPGLNAALALLAALYLCFGLGNGATFQLVPHRWRGKTGLMTGIIGAAGGIGGFYLPVIMGIAKESTGSYQPGFATFAVLAAIGFISVAALQRQWLAWSAPAGVQLALDAAAAE
jgi:NNP family nitrate/nitrite transporter-like MFS transporter